MDYQKDLDEMQWILARLKQIVEEHERGAAECAALKQQAIEIGEKVLGNGNYRREMHAKKNLLMSN